MRIILLPQAAEEFESAADYYDRQQAGLGHKFRDEVDEHNGTIRPFELTFPAELG